MLSILEHRIDHFQSVVSPPQQRLCRILREINSSQGGLDGINMTSTAWTNVSSPLPCSSLERMARSYPSKAYPLSRVA